MYALRQLSKCLGFRSEEISTDISPPIGNTVCYINQMPNKILLKIFAFLDFESQMKCHSVCVHWNRLINPILESETILITDYNHPKYCNQITRKPISEFQFQRIFEINQIKGNKSYEKISSTIISKHFALRNLSLQFNSD